MPESAPAPLGLVAVRIPDPDAIAAPPSRFGDGSTAIDVVRAALSVSTVRLLRKDAAIRQGEDAEAVHDGRVAIRRLRSHLRTLRPLLEKQPTRDLRRELRWLGAALGQVRDAEVLHERLRARLAALAGWPSSVGPLLDELEARRIAGRRSLLVAMRSPRYAELLERLVVWTGSPPGRAGRADRPADRVLALMDRPWRELSGHVAALGSDAAADELHRVRIETKRVRYAAEALSPVAGKPATRFAASAASLQEALGEHQDAVSTIRWLADHGQRAADPRVAFTAGRIAEIESAARAAARDRWPAAWRALERRKRFWS